MWMWGTEGELLADARIAGAHNESITDAVVECRLELEQPFNASWIEACGRAATTLRAAGIRVWLTLEPHDSSNMVPIRAFWKDPPFDAMRAAGAKIGATGWNFDFECDGTPQDFELYLSFLTSARDALGTETIVDANGDPCTKDYRKLAEAASYVMDMSLYYEAWPKDWTHEAGECVQYAGARCMAGLADYKAWPESEVREKVALLESSNISSIGVFTLASQDQPKTDPEPYWWPILADYLRGARA